MLSEDLAKFDGQFEGYTNKLIDVLRTAFKGDEARVDNACRIADRNLALNKENTDIRTSRVVSHELSMYLSL